MSAMDTGAKDGSSTSIIPVGDEPDVGAQADAQ